MLSPQVGETEAPRVQQDVQKRIQHTEGLLSRLDPQKLSKEQRDHLATIQNFVAGAREALSAQDLPRAATLASKAELLAEDLVKSFR